MVSFSCFAAIFSYPAAMQDDSLTKIMAELEEMIGPDRLSALRREAATRGVSIVKLLGDAVVQFSERLASSKSAA
jgi:hypothetical protein